MSARARITSCWTAVVAVSLLAAPTYAQMSAAARSWDAAIQAFADGIAHDVAEDDVGGIVAGVVVDGDLVWARGFGWADRERRTPMSTSTVSRTGSISKSVTALLMMRLADRGVLSLDDPVRRYLPEVDRLRDARAGTEPITLRHLASHTSGLIREPEWQGSLVGPIEAWEDRVLESIPQTAFDSIPGARYQYSNIGFGILGLALSRAADKPFMEMVEDEIFGPLGMTGSSFVVVGAELESRLAVGYEVRDGRIDAEAPAAQHAGRGYKVPNGGVYSTVADLGRLLGSVSGVPGLRLLSEEARGELLTVQTPEDPRMGYGLGFQVRVDDEGRKLVSHGGTVAGYNAHMAVDPDANIGVVVLRNYTGGVTNLGAVTLGLVEALREIR